MKNKMKMKNLNMIRNMHFIFLILLTQRYYSPIATIIAIITTITHFYQRNNQLDLTNLTI